ncbi:MAG TPA: hypothetical protein VGM25_09280 [Caulobacteraceae bacterium]
MSGRQRAWSMAVIWVGLAMSVLDTSIANVALPTLAGELHATASDAIWVINAYQLGMVMLLLPLAACSERLGYHRASSSAWRPSPWPRWSACSRRTFWCWRSGAGCRAWARPASWV